MKREQDAVEIERDRCQYGGCSRTPTVRLRLRERFEAEYCQEHAEMQVEDEPTEPEVVDAAE